MKQILILACVLLSLQVIAQKKSKIDPATQQVNANKEAALAALNTAYEADKKTACYRIINRRLKSECLKSYTAALSVIIILDNFLI